MIFAQFFVPKREAIKIDGQYTGTFKTIEGQYQEATGDRSVIILDGREKQQTLLELSHAEMIKRGYKACQLFKGESFTRAIAITNIFTE